MLLEGGVAGGNPPHKGGPKARPPKGEERVERSEGQPSAAVLLGQGWIEAKLIENHLETFDGATRHSWRRIDAFDT